MCSMYPFSSVSISFPPTAFVPMTNVQHEASAVLRLVTNQHLSNIQAPLYIASLCVVAVTSPSFCPRDSLGFYPSVPSFFPCPLILIPTQSEPFVKTPPQDEWMDTQRRIQLPANTIALITGVKNANR